MKNKPATIDSGKRNTLKCLAVGASAAMISLPSYADFANPKESIAINATLISIPGTVNETLILRNLRDTPLIIDRFEQASVSFDGETIDCGAVCNDATIIIPANDDVMVSFNPQLNLHAKQRHTFYDSKPLNVQDVVNRLPEGTRVIPLNAYVIGTTAILLHA